jgi:hypothetical protein
MSTQLNAIFQGFDLCPHDRLAEEMVNQSPFMFEHPLAYHALFDIGRLARLAEVAVSLRVTAPSASWVSAGMSGDLESAISHGATHVRVGSAVLGSRVSGR